MVSPTLSRSLCLSEAFFFFKLGRKGAGPKGPLRLTSQRPSPSPPNSQDHMLSSAHCGATDLLLHNPWTPAATAVSTPGSQKRNSLALGGGAGWGGGQRREGTGYLGEYTEQEL